MMGLLIRFSPKDSALRSVGDPPHGIVVVACPNGRPTFAVEGSTEFGKPGTPSHTVEFRHARGGILPTSTPVSVADLIDACESKMDVGYVVVATALTMCSAARRNMEADVPFMVDWLRAHVDFVEEVRDALIERGFLR